MKKILFIILLYPFVSIAQEPRPKFENDTLYTASGYKIFKGQTWSLQMDLNDMEDSNMSRLKTEFFPHL